MKAILSFLALAFVALLGSGCAQHDTEDFERDDYFGGHGNKIRPTHHVPEEAQRVEPWFPLF